MVGAGGSTIRKVVHNDANFWPNTAYYNVVKECFARNQKRSEKKIMGTAEGELMGDQGGFQEG